MRLSLTIRHMAALALTASAVLAQPAVAAAPRFVPEGDVMDAPRGFVDMCATEQTFCTTESVVSNSHIVTGSLATRTNGPTLPTVRQPVAPLAAPIAQAFAASLPSVSQSLSPASIAFPQSFLPASSGVVSAAATASDYAAIASALLVDSTLGQPERSSTQDLALGDKAMWSMLRDVNRIVNRRVLQVNDIDLFGEAEHWQRAGTGPNAAGDCEDIAIEKRFELIAAGFPKDRLFFAVAYIPSVGLHTVLVARTGKGDVVLDNRTGAIRRWNATPYTWLGIQSVANPMIWHRIVAA